MRLEGKNYQAWEDFSLEFEGLTAIVGPSDTGKSSISRSFKGLIRNEVSADQVRIGSSGIELTLHSDKSVITLSRSPKGSSKYEIDGAKFDKLNRGLPPPILDLKMNPIKIGDIEIDPIFAGQHDNKFMLQGLGDTALNTILGAFSSTEKLEFGKREANSKILGFNTEAKILAKEIQEAETRKFTLEELEKKVLPVQQILIQLETLCEKITSQNDEISSAGKHLSQLIRLRNLDFEVPSTKASEGLFLKLYALASARRYKQSLEAKTRLLEQFDTVIKLWTVVSREYKIRFYMKQASAFSVGSSAKSTAEKLLSILAVYTSSLENMSKLPQIHILMSSIVTKKPLLEASKTSLLEAEDELVEISSELQTLTETHNKNQLAEARKAKQVTCPECEAVFIP